LNTNANRERWNFALQPKIESIFSLAADPNYPYASAARLFSYVIGAQYAASIWARQDEETHAGFLLQVLRDEVERRQGKQLAARLKQARFEQQKTLEDFEFAFNGKFRVRKSPRLPPRNSSRSEKMIASSARQASGRVIWHRLSVIVRA
jgi:hypothetical protein